MLVRAIAALRARDPELAREVAVVICGGPSGTGLDRPTALIELAASLGVTDRVHFLPPRTGAELPLLYQAADLVAVPSYNESFGLVALEAQACGTPVVAAAVGGLVTTVRDQVSGVLVRGHDPADWAAALARLLPDRARRAELSAPNSPPPAADAETGPLAPGHVPPDSAGPQRCPGGAVLVAVELAG